MIEEVTNEFPHVDLVLLHAAENFALTTMYQLPADELTRLSAADDYAMRLECAKIFLKFGGVDLSDRNVWGHLNLIKDVT
jgi:hypothetical protein